MDLFVCSPGIPDWGIAVIVVGVLALVALFFCLIGVGFACQSNKKSGGSKEGKRRGGRGGDERVGLVDLVRQVDTNVTSCQPTVTRLSYSLVLASTTLTTHW